MRIDATLLKTVSLPERTNQATGTQNGLTFGELLTRSFESVNTLQIEADRSATDLALGKVDNLHEVMLVGERAQLALQLAIAVRNKVVEAYQEISRMQL